LDKPDQPLAGKRIVITRAFEDSMELSHALERLGAKVSFMPMVSFAPLIDFQALDQELGRISSFNAVIFLSKHAVHYFFERCAHLGIKCEMIQFNRTIAAVGNSTARALEGRGIRVDYVAKEATGEALAREIGPSLRAKHVLLPRSDRGDDRVPSLLREAGADVTEVTAYRTVKPSDFDPYVSAGVLRGNVNAVIFASPSAFQNFCSSFGADTVKEISQRVDFAVIGPTTARAIRESGARVAIQSDSASAAGLADALAKFYAEQRVARERLA
jgi:uroporphyrinogen-III synthase